MAVGDAAVQVIGELVADINDWVQKFQHDVPDALRAGLESAKQIAHEQTDEIKRDFDGLATHAKGKGEETGNNFVKGISLVAAAFSADFLIKIKDAFDRTAEYATNLSTLKIVTGDSQEQLQRMQYAFASVGVSSEAAAREFEIFQRNISDAAARGDGRSIIERLGLDPKAMLGNSMSQNISLVSDKMVNLKDATERADVATKLFGRSGYQLLPILMEGGKGLKDLGDAADKSGAVISSKMLSAFERLHQTMGKAAQTARVFYAEFAYPFVELFIRIVEGVQRVQASFEKLSENTKLNVIIGVLTASFLSFEAAIILLRKTLVSFVPEVAISAMERLGNALGLIVAIVSVFYFAWQSNFAHIQQAVIPVLNALQGWFERLQKALVDTGRAILRELAPAWKQLEADVQSLLKWLSDLLLTLLNSNAPFDALRSSASALGSALSDVIRGLDFLVTHLHDVLAAIVAVMAANVLPALIAAMGELNIWVGLVSIALKESFAVALTEGAIPAVKAFITALWGASAAEDAASLGLTLLVKVLILLGSFALTEAITNWKGFGDTIARVDQAIINFIEGAMARLLRAFGEWLIACSKAYEIAAKLIPEFQGIADGLHTAGQAALNAADNMDRYTKASEDAYWAQRRLNDVKSSGGHDTSEADFRNAQSDKNDRYVNEQIDRKLAGRGTASLLPFPTKDKKTGAGDQTGFQIKQIEAGLKPLELAVKTTEDEIKHLQDRLEELGKINSADQLRKQQSLYTSEIKLTNKEHDQTLALLHAQMTAGDKLAALARQHHEVNVPKRKPHESATAYQHELAQAQIKAAKEQLQFSDAAYSMYEKAAATKAKLSTLERDLTKLEQERFDKAVSYYKDLDNGAFTYQERMKGLNDAQFLLTEGLKKHRSTVQEVYDIEKKRFDLYVQNQKLYRDVTNANDDALSAQLKSQIAVRDATKAPVTQDKAYSAEVFARNKAIADAQDELTIATIAQTRATQEVQDAEDALAEAHKRGLTNAADLLPLETALTSAKTAEINATKDATLAQLKYKEAQEQTSKSVMDVRNWLDQLAQQVAGPVLTAMKAIQEGVNPLVAIFMALFEKSKSFHDITTILTAVFQRLAQVLDILRPVIDLLLGVIVGVANVFIGLYNVIATILNVFGAHIEKIKALNASLDQLNNNVVTSPLMEITHDLPTPNEYNAGKWQDLVAKQDQALQNQQNLNNDMNAGFATGATRLGEIVGILIAIRALLAIMGGKSLLGGGGIFGGLISGIEHLFGGGGGGIPTFAGPTLTVNADGSITEAAAGADLSTSTLDANALGLEGTGINPITADTFGGADLSTAQDTLTQAVTDGIDQSDTGSALQSTFSGSSSSSSLGGVFSTFGKVVGGLGDLAAIYTGFKSGGVLGGISAGFGAAGLAGLLGAGALAGPIGVGAGLAALLFGGKKTNPHDSPDIYNTQALGQSLANLGGSGGVDSSAPYNANGQSFTEDPRLAQELGGHGIESWLSNYIAKYGGAGLDKNFITEFTNASGFQYLKNGMVELSNGVTKYWSDIVNDANTAMQEAFQGGGLSAPNTNDLLTSATNLDLSTIFGNGQQIVPGNYRSPMSGSTQVAAPAQAPVSVQITIENVNGADPNVIRSAFEPIANDIASMVGEKIARQQQMTERVYATHVGRGI